MAKPILNEKFANIVGRPLGKVSPAILARYRHMRILDLGNDRYQVEVIASEHMNGPRRKPEYSQRVGANDLIRVARAVCNTYNVPPVHVHIPEVAKSKAADAAQQAINELLVDGAAEEVEAQAEAITPAVAEALEPVDSVAEAFKQVGAMTGRIQSQVPNISNPPKPAFVVPQVVKLKK